MLIKHILQLLLIISLCLTTDCSVWGGTKYTNASRAIYPPNHETIQMNFRDYHALYLSIHDYIDDGFSVRDPQCLGGSVSLAKEVDELFQVNSPQAGSVAKDTFFVWGIMQHGGSCQAGLIFTRDMKVKLVATFRAGMLGDGLIHPEPSVLSVYVKDRADMKYLPVLRRWAAFETRTFFSDGLGGPATYQIRIYDLNCKAVRKGRIDIPACRIRLSVD